MTAPTFGDIGDGEKVGAALSLLRGGLFLWCRSFRRRPLLTQSGRGIVHFGLHDSITDNRSHGTSAVPEGYLFSHLANESSKEGTRAGGSS